MSVHKPITPQEARARWGAEVPHEVLKVVNHMLSAGGGSGKPVVLKQSDVVARIIMAMGVLRHEVFDRHWLDFEEAYRAAGWRVEYVKPGFNESGDAFWTFTEATR